MAVNNVPGQRRALGSDIGSLGREELITLARVVCGQAAAFAGGHWNIHPENIFISKDGSPWLGGRADHAPGEWTTDELEYMAPELFWAGDGDARADVYSIGLLLYAGVTRGRLPFFAKAAGEMTNELRASALRRRMNGEAVPIPTIAGDKLGEVLRRCLAFAPEERYSDTIELSMALEPCVGEGDAAAKAMFGKPENELSEVERTMAGILASYSADEVAAVPEPEPKAPDTAPEPEPEAEDLPSEPEPEIAEPASNDYVPEEPVFAVEEPPYIPEEEIQPESTPVPEGAPASGAWTPEEPPQAEAPVMENDYGHSDPPEPPEPPEPGDDERGEPRGVLKWVIGICAAVAVVAVALNFILPRLYPAEPVVIPTPSATVQPTSVPTPSATPTPTPTPTPSPTPTPEPSSTFEIVVSDMSWTEAEQRAREMGGHLAVISDEAELERITAQAEAQGLDFVWIGLFRVNGNLQWVNPDEEGYFRWGQGEPSLTDTDGTAENFVLLWHTENGWVYNDSRNNPAALYPSIYSGNMGFACEFEG